MSQLRLLFSLALLAVWLPAAQHCNLEAAELLSQQCRDACAPASLVCSDGCGAAEIGASKTSMAALQAPPPLWLEANPFLSLPVPELALAGDSQPPTIAIERPKDWLTTWSFSRRTALPSRAPSPLHA